MYSAHDLGEEREKQDDAVPYDPARGGGFLESSSSEEDSGGDSEDESEVEDGDDFDENEGLETLYPVSQAGDSDIPSGEVTSRLAVVNMDWDNIRAVDLMAVFSSFVNINRGLGKIEEVVIYPSEFGKQRMRREEIEGPPKEVFTTRTNGRERVGDSEGGSTHGEDTDHDEDTRIRKSLLKADSGEEYSSTHLRRYQLDRLRYYYAILTCSSSALAHHIYQNIDGAEYLSSANFFDLRFIPDEMDFSEEKPRDACNTIPKKYRPNEFVTDALQHSKVKLTWDADDTKRKEVQKRAFSGSRTEINENDLQAYLGTDSSSDEAGRDQSSVESVDDANAAVVSHQDQNVISKPEPKQKLSKKNDRRHLMRSLLGLGDESAKQSPKSKINKAPVGDMQITFTSGLLEPERGSSSSVFENVPVPTEETTAEKYVRKEKERKNKRREKAKGLRAREKGVAESGDEGEANPGKGVEREDLGFNDPFFTTDPNEARTTFSKRSKEDKIRRHTEAMAKEAEAAVGREQRESLGKGNASDTANSNGYDHGIQTQEIHHFSMPLLEKAERALLKQHKLKGHRGPTLIEKAALEAKSHDVFEMNVLDPRFAAIFEQSEYALDPSHHGFKGTEGMRKLLEEGRKRRKRRIGVGEDVEDEPERRDGRISATAVKRKR